MGNPKCHCFLHLSLTVSLNPSTSRTRTVGQWGHAGPFRRPEHPSLFPSVPGGLWWRWMLSFLRLARNCILPLETIFRVTPANSTDSEAGAGPMGLCQHRVDSPSAAVAEDTSAPTLAGSSGQQEEGRARTDTKCWHIFICHIPTRALFVHHHFSFSPLDHGPGELHLGLGAGIVSPLSFKMQWHYLGKDISGFWGSLGSCGVPEI